MASESKSYILRPSWKYYFFSYLFAVLLIPLVIGIFALYLVRKKHKRLEYKITDHKISSSDARYQRDVDLSSIRGVSVSQSWMQEKLKIGDIILHTASLDIPLKGIENPENLKNLIEKAVSASQRQENEGIKGDLTESGFKPGSMDKMNYLTGLWQQGLLSDEDYKNEKKHFE